MEKECAIENKEGYIWQEYAFRNCTGVCTCGTREEMEYMLGDQERDVLRLLSYCDIFELHIPELVKDLEKVYGAYAYYLFERNGGGDENYLIFSKAETLCPMVGKCIPDNMPRACKRRFDS